MLLLVNAKSYKRIVSARGTNGILRQWVTQSLFLPGRGRLFRCDFNNFDQTTHEPLPNATETSISNQKGDWEIHEKGGLDSVAFLLTGDHSPPIQTVAIFHAFETMAEQPTPREGFVYSEVETEFEGHSAFTIAVSSSANSLLLESYVIDATTGFPVARFQFGPDSSIEDQIIVNAHVDESSFDIPTNNIVVPTDDINSSRDYLSERVASPK